MSSVEHPFTDTVCEAYLSLECTEYGYSVPKSVKVLLTPNSYATGINANLCVVSTLVAQDGFVKVMVVLILLSLSICIFMIKFMYIYRRRRLRD